MKLIIINYNCYYNSKPIIIYEKMKSQNIINFSEVNKLLLTDSFSKIFKCIYDSTNSRKLKSTNKTEEHNDKLYHLIIFP